MSEQTFEIPAGCGRESLVEAIAAFLGRMHLPFPEEARHTVARAIDEAGPGAIAALGARLSAAGADWGYYPHDPLVRRLHLLLSEAVMPSPVVTGVDHLRALKGHPVVLFSNHLSYSDANVIEVLLQRYGGQDLADRLTVVAGPKVYSDVGRRFSSLAFATIRTPQSSGVSSDDAVMSSREVAHAAKRSIEAATDRLQRGDVLLVFAEGTRSRDGGMQPFLSGVARYLRSPAVRVLPVGITGSETLYPVGEQRLSSAPITMAIGEPIPAPELHAVTRHDRQAMMDRVGRTVAGLLPPDYRGVYGD